MSLFINPVSFQNDSTGRAASFSRYDFYETETFTRKATYSDEALTSENPNPVVADAAGRFPSIYMANGESYRVVFSEQKTTNEYTAIWTKDDVLGGGTGSISGYNVGTEDNEVPTNADLPDFGTAATVDYEEYTADMSLDSSFTGGTLTAVRIGRSVTLSIVGATVPEDGSPTYGTLPASFRPQGDFIVFTSPELSSFGQYVEVNTDGTIGFEGIQDNANEDIGNPANVSVSYLTA